MAGFGDRKGRPNWQKMKAILLLRVAGLTIETKFNVKQGRYGYACLHCVVIRGETIAYSKSERAAVKAAFKRLEPEGGFILNVNKDNWEAFNAQADIRPTEWLDIARARRAQGI